MNKLEQARFLRAENLSYAKIGEQLGCSGPTVARLLNPSEAERTRTGNKLNQAARRQKRFETDAKYREWLAEKERMKNPEYRKQKKLQQQQAARDKYANDPEYRDRVLAELKEFRSTLQGRCIHAIGHSREHARKHGYAACIATVKQLIEAFTGNCLHCERSESDFKLYVDHNHETGEFRGWVCNRCNTMLGRFKDNVAELKAWLTTQPPSVPRRFIGVYPTPSGKFEATISDAGKDRKIGTFADDVSAAIFRNQYITHHGLKSRLNEVADRRREGRAA